MKSILAALYQQIQEQPDCLALRILADDDAPEISLTYGQLDAQLEATGAYLQSLGVRAGDRLAFQLPKGTRFHLAPLGRAAPRRHQPAPEPGLPQR